MSECFCCFCPIKDPGEGEVDPAALVLCPVDQVSVADFRLGPGAANAFKDDFTVLDETRGAGPFATLLCQPPDLDLFE